MICKTPPPQQYLLLFAGVAVAPAPDVVVNGATIIMLITIIGTIAITIIFMIVITIICVIAITIIFIKNITIIGAFVVYI